MKKTTIKAVKLGLDKVDTRRDEDWLTLGERLQKCILNRPEYIADFTESQKNAILECCRETYYAASIVARAYAFTAVSEAIRSTDQ